MLELAPSLLAVLAIVSAAWGLGRPILRALGIYPESNCATLVLSIGTGLLVAGFGLLGLTWADGLHPLAIVILTLVGILWGVVELACMATSADWLRRPTLAGSWKLNRGDRLQVASWGLVAVVLLLTLVRAAVPPTSEQATGTPLLGAHQMLQDGGLAAEQPLSGSTPVALWAAWAMALDGPVAANLLAWAWSVLLIGAVWLLGVPVLGTRLASLAAAVVILVPAVHQAMGTPSVAIPLACCCALALVAAQRAFEQFEPGRYELLAGAFLGTVVALDTSGLWFAASLLPVTILAAGPERRHPLHWTACLQMALTGAIVGVVWLAAGGRSASNPQNWSWIGTIGPLFPIGFGGLLFARRLRGLQWLLATLAVYSLLVVVGGRTMAAWAPLIPVAAILVAWVLAELRRLPPAPQWGVSLLVLLVAAGELVACVQSVGPGWNLASGRISREAYLTAHDGSYRAAAVLNALPGRDAVMALAEVPGLYFDRPLQRPPRVSHSVESAHPLWSLARRTGAAYVLCVDVLENQADPDSQAATTSETTALLAFAGQLVPENLAQSEEVIPILEYRFADDNNRLSRYRLWKLQGPPASIATEPVARLSDGERSGAARPATR